MNIYFLADASAGTLAIIYTVIFIIAASLAVCWIAFPFIVLSKFNELLKVTRQIKSAGLKCQFESINDFGFAQKSQRRPDFP